MLKGSHLSEDSNPLLAHTRSLMRRFGLRAKKGLGQHFLIDSTALESSIAAAELFPDDVVVEVGPGLGVLTEELAPLVRKVIAIEVDFQMADLLRNRFSDNSKVSVLAEDVLKLNIEKEVAGSSYKVVANLPYYVAAPTIRRFLEADIKPACMVVMVQEEVAKNIVAIDGKMGLMSIGVQLYGKPSIVKYVPSASFYPAPKVDSAIVKIDVYDQPAVSVEVERFFRVVKAGFSAPRKQLRNSLAKGLLIEPAAAVALLDCAGIAFQRRAETLNLQEWANLHEVVQKGLQ